MHAPSANVSATSLTTSCAPSKTRSCSCSISPDRGPYPHKASYPTRTRLRTVRLFPTLSAAVIVSVYVPARA